MIRYRLNCAKGHEFESWFQSSSAFDKLAKRKAVACPDCGSSKVEKALMAPSVKTSKAKRRIEAEPASEAPAKPEAPAAGSIAMASLPPEQRAFIDAMRKIRDHVKQNSEYVGPRFAEEARKIHHAEAEARGIHGEATPEEAKALLDDGIEVLPLPVLPDDRN
jgi:hypothetical protein